MKSLRLTVPLMLALATMAACVRVEITILVNDDGSGTVRYTYAVSDALLELEDLGLEGLVMLDGAEVKQTREDGYSGYAVTAPFDHASTLFQEQDRVLGDVFDRFSATKEEDGWRVSMVVSAVEEGVIGSDYGNTNWQLFESGTFLVSASLPGTLEEHNAERVEDGNPVWEMDFFLTEPRDLTARTTEGSKWPVIPIVAISAAVLPLALAVLSGRFMRRRGERESGGQDTGV